MDIHLLVVLKFAKGQRRKQIARTFMQNSNITVNNTSNTNNECNETKFIAIETIKEHGMQ